MARVAFCCCFLLAASAAGAGAQALQGLTAFNGPTLVPEPRSSVPQFRLPDGDLRAPGEPRRSGLIGAMRVDERLQVGVGRFAVPELARPRTHMEAEHRSGEVRRRDRGIAAVGFSFSF